MQQLPNYPPQWQAQPPQQPYYQPPPIYQQPQNDQGWRPVVLGLPTWWIFVAGFAVTFMTLSGLIR